MKKTTIKFLDEKKVPGSYYNYTLLGEYYLPELLEEYHDWIIKKKKEKKKNEKVI